MINIGKFLSAAFALACAALVSCSRETPYHWARQADGLALMDGKTAVGSLSVVTPEGVSHKEKIVALDSATYKITCTFKATRDLDSTRLSVCFTHGSPSHFWMIPSVSYNGNDWGRGKEPKGAKTDGQWRTVSYRRTPIPGALYSEGSRYAVSTWGEAPAVEKDGFSCSIQPDEAGTGHCYVWPEEEMPVTYANRDSFEPGFTHVQSLRKGESVVMQVYLHVSPVLENHRALRSFMDKAWDLAPKPQVEVFPASKLWDLGVRYAKESLWAEEGSYRGFNIGLNIDPDGVWRQRRGGKYEIGWCGQNASYAISLLQDYLKNGSNESLEKGMATLDTWSKCTLPNGLFVVHYDNILDKTTGSIDACNLGVAALNYFEAFDVARQCGYDRPEYERLAYGICDFVVSDQLENGCYAKGWWPDGSCIYREGTIGCFIVPAMIEAYRRSGNEAYLSSAQKAYRYYLSELEENGYTTAGALDTWCIDKESSISLLRSAMRFYDLTGSTEYVDDALTISYYLSTWMWHYDEIYPEGDNFTEYGYHTFGGTSVSVQHNHMDPYALYWVPEWFRLSELTGDDQWRQKALAIWKNGNQLVSDGTLEINGHVRPAGSQNEAYFECSWGFTSADHSNRINTWLVAWPGAFRLETLRHIGDPALLDASL